MWKIPLSDVVVPEEDVEAVLDCYRSGWLTMGPRNAELERRFAEAVGAADAITVSSGTAALHLSMLAAGIGPGDEVVVPALTFVAAAAAVRACGATPVFADVVSVADHNVDPASVAACVGPRTRAILATHWWGYPCDLAALQALCDEHGLLLLEDAAQAVLADLGDGRRAGTASLAGTFSLFSKKQLAVGEGGIVVTADEALAAKVRSLRSHAMTTVTWDRHRGHAESYDIVDLGFNYRLDEPRAALGLSRLPRLADDIARRRAVARRYRAALSGVDGIVVPWDDDTAHARSSHFCFGLVLADRERRDALRDGLAEQGIQTTAYPAIPAFTEYASSAARVPVALEVAARHVVLPLAASYDDATVDRVVDAVRALVA